MTSKIDVIETLARAIWGDDWREGLAPNTENMRRVRATALLAQIAPALRAEGMERAAAIIEEMKHARCADCGMPKSDHPYRHPFVSMQESLGSVDAIRAEAKRLREGGEG